MSDHKNPTHYKRGKVEAIDAIESAVVGKTPREAVCVANVIKYLWRYEDKGQDKDIDKAEWYLNRLKQVRKEMVEEAITKTHFE